jgi:hypothetical protein
MTAKTTRLTRAVKIYLDIGWWVFAAMAFGLVPLAGLLIVVVGVQEPAGDRPALPVLVGIRVNDAQLVPIESGSAEEYSALEGGQGQLRIRTGSRLGWAAVLGLAELMFLVAIYVYGQLRKLFRSLLEGRPFVEENARRVRRVGLVVVGWSLFGPLIEFFAAFPVLREVHVRGLILRPSMDFNLELLFAGLAILVLAQVLHQASALQRDQSLTV